MTSDRIIHLVDDDEAIRHSASFMLRHAGYLVRTYKDGVTFLQQVTTADEGCILLDVRMPVLDGLAVQDELTKRGISMPVVVLTGHGDVGMAVTAMRAGAIDFLEKPYEKAHLLKSIGIAFEAIHAKDAKLRREADATARLATLTPRETDVLEHLIGGLTNKQIAAELGISHRTVEIHRANLMEKLEADSLSSVIKVALAANLDSPGDGH